VRVRYGKFVKKSSGFGANKVEKVRATHKRVKSEGYQKNYIKNKQA